MIKSMKSDYHIKSCLLLIVLISFFTSHLRSQVVVLKEQIDQGWNFNRVMRPSRSDAALNSEIFIRGNIAMSSCLSPNGLHNGVLPQDGYQRFNYFCFTDENTNGGYILMDLGKVQPVSAICSYSWHIKWNDGGARGPQVYSLYGSADDEPGTKIFPGKEWTKIADVDTRPNETGANWGGQHGVTIKDKKGNIIGNYRWLVWDVKPTLSPKQEARFTNTWYTELDVHTPETLNHSGDAILSGTNLDSIFVIFKTHYDIGYTHLVKEVINYYRTDMIDNALKLIEDSQKLPKEQRFVWTIPGWPLYQILYPGQTQERRDKVMKAIREGSLQMHALAATFHTESLEPEDLVTALSFTTRICNENNLPLPHSAKMTDVPCHSWLLPTVLKNAGVDFLHLGCNPINERPDLPLLYYWQGPDGSKLLTMHSQGYGSARKFGEGLYPPKDWNYKVWPAIIMSSDNNGPPSADLVRSILEETKKNLPTVKVKFTTLDEFAEAIFKEEKNGAKIPCIAADMPDTWIHGVGSMPVEERMIRTVRPELASTEILESHLRMWGETRPDISADLFAAHEQSMMYGEHTWGGSFGFIGLHMLYGKAFDDMMKKGLTGGYKRLEFSWEDHRNYAHKAKEITERLENSAINSLAKSVKLQGKRIVVFNPLPHKRNTIVEIPGRNSVSKVKGTENGKIIPVVSSLFYVDDLPACGYKTYNVVEEKEEKPIIESKNTVTLENSFLKITIDRNRGGIVSIIDKIMGRELVDQKAEYAFGQYLYERFDSRQCRKYNIDCYNQAAWDYGARELNARYDLPDTPSYSRSVPKYRSLEFIRNKVFQKAILRSDYSTAIQANITTIITLPAEEKWVEINVKVDNKKPDTWPEAGWIYLPVNVKGNSQFRIGRNGSVVNPVDFPKGTNHTLCYVYTGAIIAGSDGKGAGICNLDHGLMSFGQPGIMKFEPSYIPEKPVAFINLFNNQWNTNFPIWIGDSISSRVRIWAINDVNPEGLVLPATEFRNPVLVGIADGTSGNLPVRSEGLSLSRDGIKITNFSHDAKKGGYLLRLWEQAGLSGVCTVKLPKGSNIRTSQLLDLRNTPIGAPIKVVNGVFSFDLHAYAPTTFILK
jgi:hypothetical protein